MDGAQKNQKEFAHRVLTGIGIVALLTLWYAAQRRSRLVPTPKRPRAAEVLQRLGYVLKWFLVGRAASMLILGVFTWAGLALLPFTPFLLEQDFAPLDGFPSMAFVWSAIEGKPRLSAPVVFAAETRFLEQRLFLKRF